MTIETYTDTYFDDVMALVNKFYNEAVQYYDLGFDPKKVIENITVLKQNNATNAFLLIIDGKCEGLLAGVEGVSLLNNKRIFQELIWYINPHFRKYGVRLLKRAEQILKEQGFNTIIMTVLEDSMPEKIKALYGRMGYKHFETQYIRNL